MTDQHRLPLFTPSFRPARPPKPRYEIHGRRPMIVDIHEPDCICHACEPYSPSAPRPMGVVEIARIAGAAMITAHIIASIIWGPATAWAVLVANLTGQPL